MFEEYQNTSGQVSGHDYVDLGLPSGNLWATCNLGAHKLHEHGDYFAWGETSAKKLYANTNYKFGEEGSYSKYCVYKEFGVLDYKIILEEMDDAARAVWGDSWYMPTQEDMIELVDYCEWWPVDDFEGTGVAGIVGISKENLNMIFFPVSGVCKDDEAPDLQYAFYWSSSLSTEVENPSAYGLDCLGWAPSVETNCYKARCYGYPIRAISNPHPKSYSKILVEMKERKTMEQVYGPWKGEIPTWTNVGMRYYNLYHVQVKDYSLSDICFLIRQSSMQEYVMPVAIDILRVKPFITVDDDPGDLLGHVLGSVEDKGNAAYWESHDSEKKEVMRIFESCKDSMKSYGVDEKSFLKLYEVFCKGEAEREAERERDEQLSRAKNLMEMGVDVKTISKATGLTKEEIENL